MFRECSGGVLGGFWGLFWGFSVVVLVVALGHLGPQVVVLGEHIGDELVGGTHLAGSNSMGLERATGLYPTRTSDGPMRLQL